MTNVLDELKRRDFIDAVTSEELKKRLEKPIKVYIGFDPTAKSLHLGNLVGIIALEWFKRYGHTPVALIGGATGKIGDPSGKSIERPLLTNDEIDQNVSDITSQLRNILGEGAQFINNFDWVKDISVIDFLRDIGKHFRLGPMLSKESVKIRVASEEGMSFTEFSYQLLQGFDFSYLYKEKNVELQMGGSDQWGNITAGIELTRKLHSSQVFGLTFPLLTRSDGKKFGKTEGGALWLSPEMCSPYDFYQYLFRIPDKDIPKMMKMLTFMELTEISEYEAKLSSGSYTPNEAQTRLAEEVTRFVHGEEGLMLAQKVTAAASPGSKAKLTGDVLEVIGKEMPNVDLTKSEVLGQTYAELAVKGKLLSSKGEANRMIKNGGAYINEEKLLDSSFSVSPDHLIDGKYLLIGAGKKKKLLIRLQG